MASSPPPPRPPTPQVLLHHLPSKPTEDDDTRNKPSKYIVLITGSTATAGKLQIARSVAAALSCPLYQGDSLHDSSAKASSVGAGAGTGGPNEARYRRMWLSKMTRTGLLFPEESRPATEGFPGYGNGGSTATSRRGSVSSIASASTRLSDSTGPSQSSASDTSSSRDESISSSSSYPALPLPVTSTFSPDGSSAPAPGASVNTVFTLSADERRRRSNPALMVLTHPELEPWHKSAIRTAVGDYGIGVIFAPLYEEEDDDLPVLRPLDPRTMSTFPVSPVEQYPTLAAAGESGSMGVRELTISVDVNDDVEGKTRKIIEAVRDVMA